eukprot:m.160631 g.160631  ORF g.160631 m.160631 type:complete len:529 (+) comp18030_c0_seq3:189-1775(+)
MNVLLLLVLVIVLIVYFDTRYKYLPAAGVSPKCYPYLGHLLEFMANWETIPDWILKYAKKNDFKKTWALYGLRLGALGDGALIIQTPENVKHVLKDSFGKYEKTNMVRQPLVDFLGNGIFTSDGSVWKLHRKVAVSMFSRALLREGTHVALNQVHRVCDKLDTFATSGKPCNIQDLFFAFTLDTFGLIAFGVNLNTINEPNTFAKAFDEVQFLSNERFGNPLWKLCRFIQTPKERKITQGTALMTDFAMGVINSKRKAAQRGDELGADLLSRFIEKNADVSDQELVDIVLNFMIAGRDTTASALSWAVLELTRVPAVVDEIRREISHVMAHDFGGARFASLTYEDAFKVVEGKLPYLKAVALETLRLHPSVTKELKYCVKDDVLPDGTAVPKGVAILWCPYAMGRDPTLWEDPEVFDPSRFLRSIKGNEGGVTSNTGGDVEGLASGHSLHRPMDVSDFKYPVFNAGPRVCLGRPLALLEMQLALAMVLSQFDLTLAWPHDNRYVNSLVSPPLNGVHVHPRRVADVESH